MKFASKCTFSCGLLSPHNNINSPAGIASNIMANSLGVEMHTFLKTQYSCTDAYFHSTTVSQTRYFDQTIS